MLHCKTFEVLLSIVLIYFLVENYVSLFFDILMRFLTVNFCLMFEKQFSSSRAGCLHEIHQQEGNIYQKLSRKPLMCFDLLYLTDRRTRSIN